MCVSECGYNGGIRSMVSNEHHWTCMSLQDFIIFTPRHKVKKTVYRCQYRMEVLVCLMRLRSLHEARSPGQTARPELQTHAFQSFKYHKRAVQSPCVIEVRPDGIYQKDRDGDLMSHIPYTSLVSIDLICDDHAAISLNHSDNSSLFIVPKRTELAQAIQRVMKSYGMQINEYRKKTMEAVCKDETGTTLAEGTSFQYRVLKLSSDKSRGTTSRLLSVSEKYITEAVDSETVVSSRPLSRVYSIVLFRDSPQVFQVVFVDGIQRTYSAEHHEKIVCDLLASCHALGNTQVDIVTTFYPEWMRMLPRKIIQNEARTAVRSEKEASATDRELRVVQASIVTLLATHGTSKTVRTQRQLPKGLDGEMHSIALELNVNTPTSGVIMQPNKPFDKAAYVVAREIHDIVTRHGPAHEFIPTYLQTLYRLIQAPPAMKEFVRILVDVSVRLCCLVGRSAVVFARTDNFVSRVCVCGLP